MGYSTTDGATGKGLGSFTTTPTTAADFNKAIELIGRMGNRRVGTTAQHTALTGPSLYEGLEFYDTDLSILYRRVGSTWAVISALSATITTFGTGFTATAGYTPKVVRDGNRVEMTGVVTVGASSDLATNILTVAAIYRPTGLRFAGYVRSSNTMEGMLHIDSTGVLTMPPLYRSGTITTGNFVPVHGSWFLD